MKKVLNFFFPLPSLIIYIILMWLFWNSTLDGIPITFNQWLSLGFYIFIFVIIPLDIFLDFKRKKRKMQHQKQQGKKITFNQISMPTKELDPLFFEAGNFFIEKGVVSSGMLQRIFKIGFNRAQNIINQLRFFGVVGQSQKQNPMYLLMSSEEWYEFVSNFDEIFKNSAYCFSENTSPKFNTSKIQMYNGKYDYMEGHDFEYFCAYILKKNGFCNIEVTPESNDQGIDIIAFKDNVKYGIQCKRYNSDVGNFAVQEAFSGSKFYNCHVPVVLTNRYFTAAAVTLAKKTNVLLWDRDYLDKLIKESEK